MTQQQKERITEYRASGASYGQIAKALGLSVNTVKSYCQRNPIGQEQPKLVEVARTDRCAQCNARLVQTPGHRQKRFCSTKCRNRWWQAHLDQMKRKTMKSWTCQYCGYIFQQYGGRPRKFCSRECYLAHRRGGGFHG